MPYIVVRRGTRCRVKKSGVGRPRWFSRKAIPCALARAQQRALYAANRRRTQKIARRP
jgi:hypothetical protein